MASGKGTTKSTERTQRAKYADKAKHLRSTRFDMLGFKSNERTPSLNEGRAMAAGNLRRMSGGVQGRERDMATPSLTT